MTYNVFSGTLNATQSIYQQNPPVLSWGCRLTVSCIMPLSLLIGADTSTNRRLHAAAAVQSQTRLTRPTLWPSHASRHTMSIKLEPKPLIVVRLSRVSRSNSPPPSCRTPGSAVHTNRLHISSGNQSTHHTVNSSHHKIVWRVDCRVSRRCDELTVLFVEV